MKYKVTLVLTTEVSDNVAATEVLLEAWADSSAAEEGDTIEVISVEPIEEPPNAKQ
jgi:hypothetical protein